MSIFATNLTITSLHRFALSDFRNGSQTLATNLSQSTNSTLYDEIVNQPRAPWWAMTLISVLIFVVVSANLLVIAAFLSEWGRQREPFGYFLLNLAISDYLLGCFSMPNYALYTYYGYWPSTYKHCSFWIGIDYIGTSETLLGIMVTALNRFWAVTWPISYRNYNTGKTATIATIAMTWFFVLLGTLPGVIYSRLYLSDLSGPHDCVWDIDEEPSWASFYYPALFLEWIPTITTVTCYVIIIWKISRMSLQRRIAPGHAVGPDEDPNRRSSRSRHKRDERQAFWLVTLLVGALVLSWSPWFIYQALSLYGGYYSNEYYFAAFWVGYSLSAFNPFLFNVANDDMRRAIRKMLLYVCGQQNSDAGVRSGVLSTT